MSTKSITVEPTPNGVCILTINETIKKVENEDLQSSFLECFDNGCYRIIIDFSNAGQVYSPIIRVLSWASEIVANNQGRLILASISSENYLKFDKIGLDELMEMVPDLQFATDLLKD